MRIAVMGAGAVGGYFGGLLARAGNEVTLVTRGAHLEAIRSEGLHVKSHWGDFTVSPDATDDPTTSAPVELVVLTVKTYQNAQALPALAPILDQDTAVLTLQNGVDTYQEAAGALGQDRVLPGAAYIEAHIESPGTVRQVGEVVRVVFGETDGSSSARAERILETLLAAGINAELSGDVVKELWTKFLFISALAGTTSVSRASMARLLEREEPREMVLAAMREVEAVGRAYGVNLDTDVVDRTWHYVETTARDLHASMHTDLEMGRPLELEALTGAVVRIGKQVGVPTPVNSVLYSMLLPHKEGAEEVDGA